MTWNVWWRFGGEWQLRAEAIEATLAASEPDLVGLQEAWATADTDQAAELASRLGMHSAFGRGSYPPPPEPVEDPDQLGVDVGVGLLSRWPITSSSVRPLPAAHHVPPVALMAEVAHPLGPLRVVVATTEWEPAFRDDHEAQAVALAALLEPGPGDVRPAILLADLNAEWGSEELAGLSGCTDLFAAAGGAADAVTLSRAVPFAPLEAVRQIDRRIDHVVAGRGRGGDRLRPHTATVLDRPVDGVWASDHFAVVVDVELDPIVDDRR
ncbi:endonuclease/exonuclease/phosphatase family protein [Agromyces albus]|uniref:endonuclease/exonuclease/phosphatase family protein n=1 Tax=Agromyces albus TaxID=205332 RepID=UPI0027854553|nr:endonuclease/exonuclease/phosphatase family protein [Agromyces albus]MDQ0574608.1 endonuclease/exonuclease/phosphatase family metal-dependent hydrolase [Agromyces albus]